MDLDNSTSFLPFCLMPSWGPFQHCFPLSSRTTGSSGLRQAGTLLFLAGCGNSMFISSKTFPLFCLSLEQSSEATLWATSVQRTQQDHGKWMPLQGSSFKGHEPPTWTIHSSRDRQQPPSLACLHFTSTSPSPGCEATRGLGKLGWILWSWYGRKSSLLHKWTGLGRSGAYSG